MVWACNKNILTGDACENPIIVPAITDENLILQSYMSNTSQWFQFTPNSNDLMISILFSNNGQTAPIDRFYLYSGDCNNLNLITSIDVTEKVLNIRYLSFIPGNTYFLKTDQNTQISGFYRLAFYKNLNITADIGIQQKLFSLPNGQYIDFTENGNVKNLAFEYFSCNAFGNTTNNIVHDKDGNLLFYIKNTDIFNKNGNVINNVHSTNINSNGLSCTPSSVYNECSLPNPEISIIPAINSCNEYFIIYSLAKFHSGSGAGLPSNPVIFYRKLTYIDDNNITLTDPATLACNDNSSLCSDEYKLSIAVTDIQPDNKRLLFICFYREILVFEVTEAGIDISSQKSIFIGDINQTVGIKSEMEIIKKTDGNYLLITANDRRPIYRVIEITPSFLATLPSNSNSYDTTPYENVIISNTTSFLITLPNATYGYIPKGIEFSASANRIFFTYYGQDALYYADLNGNIPVINYIPFNNTETQIPYNPAHYQYSLIELARDGNIYLVAKDGASNYFSMITNLDSPLPILIENCLTGATTSVSLSNDPFTYYAFPDQIDGSDYETGWQRSYYTNSDINFSGNDLWTPQSNPFHNNDGTIYFNDDIIIPAGKKVTIQNMTLFFTHGKKIQIQPSTNVGISGAQLILNNTILANGSICSTTSPSWGGIQLNGNGSSQFQLGLVPSRQPLLLLTNTNMWNGELLSVNGGVVKATNSGFYDNRVIIQNFNNSSVSHMNQSAGYFKNCIFDYSGYSSAYSPANSLVLLNNYKGTKINFIGNIFRYSQFDGTFENNVYGIKSIDADYSLFSYYSQPNRFVGLRYGIEAQSINSFGSKIYIDKVEFENTWRCAYFNNANNLTITRCNITGMNYWPNNQDYGIYLDNCSGFKIEENNITSKNAGIFVNNSGEFSANQLYRNTITYAGGSGVANRTATVALSNNGDATYGLKFKCNKYNSNIYNIAVIYGSVLQNQGSYDESTGNTFENETCYNMDNSFHVENSTLPFYRYYFNIAGDPTDLGNCHSSVVFPQQIGIEFDESQQCLSSFAKPITPIGQGTDQIALIEFNLSIARSGLTQLVDKGNTALLLNMVINATNGNFKNLCNKLMEATPYLSDTVLLSFIRQKKVFNPSKKTAVLLANSPLPQRAKEELENVVLPQHFIDLLKQQQQGIYEREKKEQEINSLLWERQALVNTITNDALKRDSINGVTDSLITMLLNDNDYTSKFTLIPLLINEGKFSDATTNLATLQLQTANLQQTKQDEIDNYVLLQQIVIAYQQAPENQKINIVSANSGFLNAIALNESALGNGSARILLQLSGLATFTETYKLPSLNSSTTQKIRNNNSNNMEDIHLETIEGINKLFNIFPNPAKDKLNVEYSFDEDYGNCIIEIYSDEGKLIQTCILNDKVNTEEIDVSHLSIGHYLIVIKNRELLLFTKSISIIK